MSPELKAKLANINSLLSEAECLIEELFQEHEDTLTEGLLIDLEILRDAIETANGKTLDLEPTPQAEPTP